MLRDSKIAFVFIEVTSLARARTFYEDVLGLQVIENQFNPPHHRHGIVKFDAGDTILALNIADRAFDPAAHEPITNRFSGGPQREAKIYAELQILGFAAPASAGSEFRDADGHRFSITRASNHALWRGPDDLGIDEIEYEVDNLSESVAFYENCLGLMRADEDAGHAIRFSTGNVRIRLTERAHGFASRDNGHLTVFYTPDVTSATADLRARRVPFAHPVRFTDIGGAVRFTDPSGNQFCLYEPSEIALNWDSGPKLREIMTRAVPVATRADIVGLLSPWVV